MRGVIRRLQALDDRLNDRNRRPLSRGDRWLVRHRTAVVVAAFLVTTAALVAGVLANPSGNDSTLPNWFLFTIPLQTGLAAYVAIRSLERRAAAQSQDESRADGR